MSTEKYNNRFAELAKIGETVFHSKDLANLWQITNFNTLYTTLKRYAQKKLIFKIYKGFYGLKSIAELDPLLIGVKAVHRYCYISAETVLEQAGIINQTTNKITLISSQNKKFFIGSYHYYCRKLNDRFLFNPAGLTEKNGVKIASLERATADLLYFNPRAYFDAEKLIDWKKVRQLQQTIGYPLTTIRYAFTS